ncbi:hypothetical protein [Xanthobacter flavus]|uniref:hypothetical protein n=1 Tax=Xanthobacter flavus TaxID=281 RepID=UPI00372AE61D
MSVSEYSSGPVEPDEILIRIIVAPQHINPKKKQPKAGALADAERGGLSIFRATQANNEDIRKVAQGLVERARVNNGEKAGVFGVIQMRCQIIRECRAQGESAPAYGVYDTALQDLRAHSEAFQRVFGVEKDLMEERRAILFSAVQSEFVSVHDFRGGFLADLAPKVD